MATLTRWEPIREWADMRSNMDRMMERFFEDPFFANAPTWSQRNGGAWNLALDVAEDPDHYIVKASVPGINPEDIEITLTDNVLTIKGETKEEKESQETNWHVRERRYGNFMRSVTLPASVDANKVEATNENGVLTLRVPKAEAVKPKKITVKSTVNAS
jgi:HSP20 family protein